MVEQVIRKIARSRIAASRVMGAAVVLLAMFSGHSFDENSFINMFFETFGRRKDGVNFLLRKGTSWRRKAKRRPKKQD